MGHEDAQDVEGNTDDNYTRVEMTFNSLMIEIFEVSNIEEHIQHVFVYIKAQVGKPRMPESGFTLDKIMRLHIIFHRLALTRGSSQIKLPEEIVKKKAVINPKNNNEEYFK